MSFFLIVIFFNGFFVFMTGNWDVNDFVTSYVGIPIFFALYLFWKLAIMRDWKFWSPAVKPESADIWTGKAAIDAEYWPERLPRNFLEKVWFWIA